MMESGGITFLSWSHGVHTQRGIVNPYAEDLGEGGGRDFKKIYLASYSRISMKGGG